MSPAAMEAEAAKPAANEEPTMVATRLRLAAICDMIEGHRGAADDTYTSKMSPSAVASISNMIDVLAGTAAEGRRRTARRGNRRMINVGSYEKVCVLGEGGFGVVFRERHRVTGQDAAVKYIHEDERIGLLLREASFMAACRGHPSLVAFHCVARGQGTKAGYSLVMEHVGPDLGRVLDDRGKPFPESDVRAMMRQLLEGAAALHEHGIVHRDIKPDNILVAEGTRVVKICDLGLAKSMLEKDDPFLTVGTKGYMAPEMLLWNADHDALVDTWSLGCVMAELLTGKIPFNCSYEDETKDQLYKIFDVLGVPGKRAWQALKPHEDLDDDVKQWRARHRRLGHRNRLHELFPAEILSRDGFEVLNGLLTCDPKKRLSAKAALQCPWFAVPEKAAVPDANVVSGAATKSPFSLICWQTAMSFAGRALQLLRPNGLLK